MECQTSARNLGVEQVPIAFQFKTETSDELFFIIRTVVSLSLPPPLYAYHCQRLALSSFNSSLLIRMVPSRLFLPILIMCYITIFSIFLIHCSYISLAFAYTYFLVFFLFFLCSLYILFPSFPLLLFSVLFPSFPSSHTSFFYSPYFLFAYSYFLIFPSVTFFSLILDLFLFLIFCVYSYFSLIIFIFFFIYHSFIYSLAFSLPIIVFYHHYLHLLFPRHFYSPCTSPVIPILCSVIIFSILVYSPCWFLFSFLPRYFLLRCHLLYRLFLPRSYSSLPSFYLSTLFSLFLLVYHLYILFILFSVALSSVPSSVESVAFTVPFLLSQQIQVQDQVAEESAPTSMFERPVAGPNLFISPENIIPGKPLKE